MSSGGGFAWGLFGGVVVQFLDIMRVAKLPPSRRGPWVKSTFYWGTVLTYGLVGGLFALALSSGADLRPAIAINVGAAWPLILDRGAKNLPTEEDRIN